MSQKRLSSKTTTRVTKVLFVTLSTFDSDQLYNMIYEVFRTGKNYLTFSALLDIYNVLKNVATSN
jgi:hypothetical protein